MAKRLVFVVLVVVIAAGLLLALSRDRGTAASVSQGVTGSVETAARTGAVQSAVCPVMGSKIADVTKASGHSVYKGKTYYFCCPGCKPQFDKNPGAYVK